jgi:hypothetical protein
MRSLEGSRIHRSSQFLLDVKNGEETASDDIEQNLATTLCWCLRSYV